MKSGAAQSALISAWNADGGAQTRYYYYFRCGSEAISFENETERFPRWSQSTLPLILYALNKLLVERKARSHITGAVNQLHIDDPILKVRISITVCPEASIEFREYEGLRASIVDDIATCNYRNRFYDGPKVKIKISDHINRFELAQRLISHTLYGDSEGSPISHSLHVPTHIWGTTEYVCLSDLPKIVRSEYARYMPYIEALPIPMHRPGDCVRPTDWDAFVSNSAYLDRPDSAWIHRAV